VITTLLRAGFVSQLPGMRDSAFVVETDLKVVLLDWNWSESGPCLVRNCYMHPPPQSPHRAFFCARCCIRPGEHAHHSAQSSS